VADAISTSERFCKISALALAGAAVSTLFSIAISQILLGVALAAWLLSKPRLDLPAWWRPLLLYMAWTVLSALLSPPIARHNAQILKLWLFGILLLEYGFQPAYLVAVACLSSMWGMVQFVRAYYHWLAMNMDFYTNYQLHRITGFKHHWMPFSGELMLVLMLVLVWLFHHKPAGWMRAAGWAAAVILATGLVLSFTRGAWVGCAAGGVYILWMYRDRYRRVWLLALPVVAVLGYAVAPAPLQVRIRAIVDNRDDYSAEARRLMLPTGIAMIKAHPLIGVGPEGVKDDFDKYRPDRYKAAAWYGHLHSDYLQTAASRGLPALAFVLWLFAVILRDLHRLGKTSPGETSWIARGAAAACIAYYVEGLFEYNFGTSDVLTLWLFIVALGYSVRRKQMC
jgi:putative inorganic carbon (HCO3(-)) transporter